MTACRMPMWFLRRSTGPRRSSICAIAVVAVSVRGSFDVEPEWATEAVSDPRRLVGSAGSRSGLTVKVLGWSSSAPSRTGEAWGRLLKVIVAPKDHPPAGRWWGATAMEANEADRRRYEEEP